jgi:glycosyltransferase involved in cell wall biosynthesis
LTDQVTHSDSQSTVVIPFYNGKDFIRPAVESIYAQTVLPKEIIIVDDCSTDDSYCLLNQLKAESQIPMQIHKLDQNSGGPVIPMSVGIRKATTEFVTLLDQDDVMIPNRIKNQIAALKAVPSAFACTGFLIKIDQHGAIINDGFLKSVQEDFIAIGGTPISGGIVLDPSLSRDYVFFKGTLTIASNTTLRKSTWEQMGGFGQGFRIAWDLDFSLRGLNQFDIVCVEEPVGFYRVHPGNTSGNSYQCAKEIAKCRRSWSVSPGRGLNLKTVKEKIAADSYGLSFLESQKGRHRDAIHLACLSFQLRPSFSAFMAVTKAMVKLVASPNQLFKHA